MAEKNSNEAKYTVEDILPHVTRVRNYSWEIQFQGAECEFELSSDEDAVIHHLMVPEVIQNQGIGTVLIQTAEYVVRSNTNAQTLYISIGAPTEASAYVIEKKCGFEITGAEESKVLGTVIDGWKNLN